MVGSSVEEGGVGAVVDGTEHFGTDEGAWVGEEIGREEGRKGQISAQKEEGDERGGKGREAHIE